MAIFNEHFPADESPFKKFMERQSFLSEIAAALKQEEEDDLAKQSLETLSVVSNYSLNSPSHMKMSESIAEMKRHTDNELRESKDIGEKLEKIQEIIKNFDDIACSEPVEEDEEDEEEEDDDTKSIESRVHQLEDSMSREDSSADLWIPYESHKKVKVRAVRPTKASILKSNFTKTKNYGEQKAPAPAPATKNSKLLKSSSLMSVKSEVAKIERSMAVRKEQNVSHSVRKILDDAKEKHRVNYLQHKRPKNPINVVDLRLIN
jgi:regulator of sigma D